MNSQELKKRIQIFAFDIIKLIRLLPNSIESQVLGKELLCSGTSVCANYRASCRAISYSDFISKLKISEEEADECIYWLELIQMANITKSENADVRIRETMELIAILTATGKTARQNEIKNHKSKINFQI